MARWALYLLAAAWSLLLLAWCVLHWAILPNIDDWRPRLEAEATRALGVQLRVGKITVTSGGWIPALTLEEVRLLDPQGREALRLPRVSAAVSARSLLTWSLRFEQLHLDGPQLEIRRDAAGKIFIAGLDLDAGDKPEASGVAEEWMDWFFSQHEFAIRQGRVRWIDERRKAPPLELAKLDLVLRNGLRRHDIRLDATPPAAWGERFSLRGQFNQTLLKRRGDVRFWSGQVFADLPRADLRELRRHIDLPFELSEGDGALRAWIDVKNGRPVSGTADLGLRSVKLRLTPKAEELALASIEGRLQLASEPQRLSLQATQLGFVSSSDGVVWPRSNWGVQLKLSDKDGTVLGGEVHAERLDFALMAQIAERLPVGEAPRRLLDEMAPQGLLSGLSARWDGPLDAPATYRVKAHLEGLSARAGTASAGRLGRPGIAGGSVDVEATEKGGQARIAIADGGLDLPGLFEEPQLPLSRLAGQVAWTITRDAAGKLPPALDVKVSELTIANPDLRGEFDGSWKSGAGAARLPGSLVLDGRIERLDAVRVVRYLPFVVGEKARGYVKDAVRGGEARDVFVKVRGDLAEFPFAAPRSKGQFRIATQARGVSLAYVPPHNGQPSAWPPLEQIDAELVFDRASMLIRKGKARVFGYELGAVAGGIKDLGHNPTLDIEGSGTGALSELLRFMRESPVSGWTGRALDPATATGNAALKLVLQLPLDHMDKSQVKGTVQLMGTELRLRPDVPLLAATRAKVDFDQKGVTVSGGQARALGGDLQIEGGSQKDGALRFTATGVATADGLRRAPELGLPARLAQVATGQAAYRLQLGFNGGQMAMDLSSNLQGMALDLPAPGRKEAEASQPLRVQITPQAGNRDELRIDMGALGQAVYLRDTSAETSRVLRGAIAVGDTLPPLPESGVLARAQFGRLNVDAWQEALPRLTGGANGSADGSAAANSYVPNQIGLQAKTLQIAGRPVNQLVAGISHVGEGNSWRLSVDAEQLSGFMELRAAQGAQAARVYARLARLSLPRQEAESVTQMLDSQPGTVPSLDIVVEDLELRGKRLGRLEVQAQAGAARDWRLSKLQIRHPDAVLNATGQWLGDPGLARRRTLLDWTLEVSDAGELLEKLGQGRVLRGGKGRLEGQIGWLGSPLSPDYASMGGQLTVALDRGQFLQAEPGVGRLLGVLSLQSLPRRFLLDFRDVFNEGFSFDGVSGDVKINAGVASSDNLKMRGVQAAVLLEGSANLAAETQNLRVLVVPEINAGGASLAYAAINPLVGLGTFLAQLLLSKPMAAANTREFHITGRWDDPKVQQVDHQAQEPAPAASGAAR